MANRCYVADVGTVITLETGTNLTTLGATSVVIKVQKPSSATSDWAASIVSATPTQITHTTVTGDLDEAGMYYLQAYIVSPTGTWRGDSTPLEVLAAFS